MAIFYSLRFETSPTLRVRSPYLYPPGTGWPPYLYPPGTGLPSYTPRHWVTISQRTVDSLCSLGTDRIENNSPNSSLVAIRSYRTDRVENTGSKLLHCCMLRICCLATGVFAEPFPSNGCLCWLSKYTTICTFEYIASCIFANTTLMFPFVVIENE
jgi:hypothetical protein